MSREPDSTASSVGRLLSEPGLRRVVSDTRPFLTSADITGDNFLSRVPVALQESVAYDVDAVTFPLPLSRTGGCAVWDDWIGYSGRGVPARAWPGLMIWSQDTGTPNLLWDPCGTSNPIDDVGVSGSIARAIDGRSLFVPNQLLLFRLADSCRSFRVTPSLLVVRARLRFLLTSGNRGTVFERA